MKVYIRSMKRIGEVIGSAFYPQQTMRMEGKQIVPHTELAPVIAVALVDQIVFAPPNDLLMLWAKEEPEAIRALEQHIIQQLENADTKDASAINIDDVEIEQLLAEIEDVAIDETTDKQNA